MAVDDDFPNARFGAQFGDRVQELREARGLSVMALVRGTGMSRGTAWKLERGLIENPSLALMLALQRALGLGSIEELLGPLPSQQVKDEPPAAEATG